MASIKMVSMMKTMLEDMVEAVVTVAQRRALTDTLTRHIRDVLPHTHLLTRDLPTTVNRPLSLTRLPLMDNKHTSCSTLQLATPLLPMLLDPSKLNVAIQLEEPHDLTVREEDVTSSSTHLTRMMKNALCPMILNHQASQTLQMIPTTEMNWKNSS